MSSGQRKHIDSFDLFFKWVFKFLGHVYARQKTADLDPNVSVLEWTDGARLAILAEHL